MTKRQRRFDRAFEREAKKGSRGKRLSRVKRRWGKSRTKARSTFKHSRRPKRWIQKLHVKKGALHRALGIPQGQKIPYRLKLWASKQPGHMGKMGRLALRFHFMTKNRKKKARR